MELQNRHAGASFGSGLSGSTVLPSSSSNSFSTHIWLSTAHWGRLRLQVRDDRHRVHGRLEACSQQAWARAAPVMYIGNASSLGPLPALQSGSAAC